MKILIADDSKTNKFILKKIFLKLDITDVDFVCDGFDAVQKYNQNNYSLVFLDQRMPKMNGDIAAKNILNLNPKAKIVSISSYENVDKNLFCAHFEKPFTTESLGRLLKTLEIR